MPIVTEKSVLGSNNDEAYLYQLVNLNNKKRYVGVHKGSANDDYLHSSTNVELKKELQEDDFSYEILEYGSYKEMSQREHIILLEADAKNNDEFYNLSNGFPQYNEPDFKKVKNLFDQIKDNFYPKKKEPLSEHENMDALQVRFQNHGDHQKTIAEYVTVARGDTENCFGKGKGLVVVVFEGRGARGSDLRIDGNHSVHGSISSGLAHSINVIRIPYEVNQDFTDLEIRMLANLLNKKNAVARKEMSEQDAIKYVLDNNASGINWNADINVKALKAFGFNGNKGHGKICTILTKAKQLIDSRSKRVDNGLIWIDYSAEQHKTTLSDTADAYKTKTCCVKVMSSGLYRLDRLLEYLRNQNMIKEEIKSLMVIIYHPNTTKKAEWPALITKWKAIQDTFLKGSGFKIDYEVMPSWTKDLSESVE